MADIPALIERLKENKLALPAIGVGVIVGGYVLLKKGGLSGGAQPQFDTSTITQPDQTPAPQPSAGSGDTGAIDAIVQQQDSFAKSITDQFNKFAEGIGAALGVQQQQAQAAIDQLAGQIQQVGAYQQLAGSQPQMAGMPDFSSLFSQLQAIPQTLQQSYQSPQMALGGTYSKIQSLPKATINTTQLGAKYKATIKAPAPVIRSGGIKLGSGFNLGSLSGYKAFNPSPVKTKPFAPTKPIARPAPKYPIRRTAY